jgi:hypothetical protein
VSTTYDETGWPDAPQVSWKAIEPNAEVIVRGGEKAGHVGRIVGDSDADIFTGLAVVPRPLGKERFIDAEHVTGIWPDAVAVDLTREQVEALPEHEDAPVERWRPDEGGFFARLAGLFGRRRP